jgi:hypothetical protein
MQKGMPNFYEYNGQKYSLNFPVYWASTHHEGSGPEECGNCNTYGCDDGIFKQYCTNCQNEYAESPRNTGEYSLSLSNIDNDDGNAKMMASVRKYSTDGEEDDSDMTIISDFTEEPNEGIGCNKCYSCVSGGSGPCVLDLESNIDEDEEEGIGCNKCYSCVSGGSGPCVLDTGSLLSHEFNLSIYRNPNVSSMQTIDVSCTYDDDDGNDEYVDDIHHHAQNSRHNSFDMSLSSVAPIFDGGDDIADEINRYIKENPIYEQYDYDQYEYGIGPGLHQMECDSFDITAGYNSY